MLWNPSISPTETIADSPLPVGEIRNGGLGHFGLDVYHVTVSSAWHGIRGFRFAAHRRCGCPPLAVMGTCAKLCQLQCLVCNRSDFV